MHASKNPGREHRRGKSSPFFIGPVGHNDGVFCFDVHIIERADNLQPGQHAQHAIIFAACGLCIKVRANINGQGVRVCAFVAHKHVAHLVNAHGHARIFAPFAEKMATFAIFIGYGLAVVATAHTGTDFSHFHQAVPKPVAVDFVICPWCCHWSHPLDFHCLAHDGKVNTAPSLMPSGHLVVTVFSRV